MPFDDQMVTFEEIIKNDFLKWTQYLFSQFLTILQRRSMEMFSDILAKERSVGETENTRNFLYRLARRS